MAIPINALSVKVMVLSQSSLQSDNGRFSFYNRLTVFFINSESHNLD